MKLIISTLIVACAILFLYSAVHAEELSASWDQLYEELYEEEKFFAAFEDSRDAIKDLEALHAYMQTSHFLTLAAQNLWEFNECPLTEKSLVKKLEGMSFSCFARDISLPNDGASAEEKATKTFAVYLQVFDKRGYQVKASMLRVDYYRSLDQTSYYGSFVSEYSDEQKKNMLTAWAKASTKVVTH